MSEEREQDTTAPPPALAIRMTPTAQLAEVEGVRCRVWRGVTDDGVPCVLFVWRLASTDDAHTAAWSEAMGALPPAHLTPLVQVLGTPETWGPEEREGKGAA